MSNGNAITFTTNSSGTFAVSSDGYSSAKILRSDVLLQGGGVLHVSLAWPNSGSRRCQSGRLTDRYCFAGTGRRHPLVGRCFADRWSRWKERHRTRRWSRIQPQWWRRPDPGWSHGRRFCPRRRVLWPHLEPLNASTCRHFCPSVSGASFVSFRSTRTISPFRHHSISTSSDTSPFRPADTA